MTLKSKQTYRHYRRCKAVGRFPEDDLVEHNAAIIRAAEDEADRADADKRHSEVLRMLALVVKS